MNSSGVLQWGTYFGGPGNDRLSSVTTDASGNVYVVGATGSSSGIATTGAHQTTYSGGHAFPAFTGDGMLAKFSSSGTLVWATYYGGSGLELCYSIVTDASDNLFISGSTSSSSGISTLGSHQPSMSGAWNMFLARFSSAGVRQWGTYYSGVGATCAPYDLTVDTADNLYVTGHTASTAGIATSGAYQSTNGGLSDVFIGKLSSDGVQLWGSYFGGGTSDYGHGIAYNKGSFYLAGDLGSSGLSTLGAHQTAHNGLNEGFLAKFGMDTVVNINQPYIDTVLCIDDSVHIPYSVSLPFRSNNSFILQLSNSTGSFASPVNLATLSANTGGTFHTKIPANTLAGTGYRLRIISSQPAQVSSDNNIDIRISPLPSTPIATSNSPVCEGSSLDLSANSTTPGVTYSWDGPNAYSSHSQNPSITNVSALNAGTYIAKATLQGCTAKQHVPVTVKPKPATPVVSNNSPLCGGAALNLTATSATTGASYHWQGPNGFTSTTQNPTIDPVFAKDSGDYKVVAILNGCVSDTATTKVTVNTVTSAGIYVSPKDTLCVGGTATFVVMPQNVGVNPQVQWYINGNPVNGETAYVFTTSTLSDGDSVYCQIKVTGVCTQVLTIYTFGIKMKILPGTTVKPEVTITSVPAQPRPAEAVIFTAVDTHGGATPGFQWQRDGVDAYGAVNATFSANDLTPWEEIRCIYTSSDVCAYPKSDTSNVIIANFPIGIREVGVEGFHLYPNPNKGSFSLKGAFTSNSVEIEVVNAVGQRVYRADAKPVMGEVKIDMGFAVARGVYLVRVKDGDVVRQVRFSVTE